MRKHQTSFHNGEKSKDPLTLNIKPDNHTSLLFLLLIKKHTGDEGVAQEGSANPVGMWSWVPHTQDPHTQIHTYTHMHVHIYLSDQALST